MPFPENCSTNIRLVWNHDQILDSFNISYNKNFGQTETDKQTKKAQRQSSVTRSVTLTEILNSQGDIYF